MFQSLGKKKKHTRKSKNFVSLHLYIYLVILREYASKLFYDVKCKYGVTRLIFPSLEVTRKCFCFERVGSSDHNIKSGKTVI